MMDPLGIAGAERIPPSPQRIRELTGATPHLDLRNLRAGYGDNEVIHGADLAVGHNQSLCIVGPNGCGKSTLFNAIFGLADLFAGDIVIAGKSAKGATPRQLLRDFRASFVLQTSSLYPDMTIEENIRMGGYVLDTKQAVTQAAERIFEANPILAKRRSEQAGVLSGGERRLLEISRALMVDPEILLLDEPSIGLEPRGIETVFELLVTLQQERRITVVLIEQNAVRGLEFAELGCVMVSGRITHFDVASRLLDDREVGTLFLGLRESRHS